MACVAPDDRRAPAAAHAGLGSALVAIAERAGLGDQAAAVASRLARLGVEHDPVQLVALHSETPALIAETLATADRAATAAEVRGSRGQVRLQTA